jgi:hypothetical protein
MVNQCNFAGYLSTDPKKITDNLMSVSIPFKKKDQNGNETTTWVNIKLSTKSAHWLSGLQKGDYVVASNCEFEVTEHNGVKYPSFFAFRVESPTLQARSKNNQGQQQPSNGNPSWQPQGGNEHLEEDIPF